MIKQELNENIKAAAVLGIFAWIFFANLDMELNKEQAPRKAFTLRPMTERVHKWWIWGSFKHWQWLQRNSFLPVSQHLILKILDLKGRSYFDI